MKRRRLTFLIFLIGAVVIGQESSSFTFTRYGIEDGLPNLSMNVLGQDSTGYIWLKDPLTRFDGVNFKTYLVDAEDESSGFISEMRSMADDGHGNLVFVGNKGAYYFDHEAQYVLPIPSVTQNASWRRVFYSKPNTFWDLGTHHLVKIEFPSLDTTTLFLEDYVYHETHWKTNRFGPQITDQVLWINIKGNQTVRRIDLQNLSTKDIIIHDIEDDTHSVFVYNDADQLYLISEEGVWLYDEAKDTFNRKLDITSITIDNKILEPNSFRTVIDQDNIWFYDHKKNILYYYNPLTQESQSIHCGKEINVTGMLPGAKGSMLLGSMDNGIAEVDMENDTIYWHTPSKREYQDLENNYLFPETRIGQNVFFLGGFGQGLVKAEKQILKFEKFQPIDNNSKANWSYNVRAFETWNDKIIVGSISDVTLFDPIDKSFSDLPVPGPSPLPGFSGVFDMAKDNYNNLLLSFWRTRPALFYFDYNNQRIISLQKHFPQIDFDIAYAFYFDSQNNYWLSNGKEIIKIPSSLLAEKDIKKADAEVQTFDMTQHFPKNRKLVLSHAFEEDANNQIWMGTNFGLFCINPIDGQLTYYKNEPDNRNSLGHNDICSLKAGKDNTLWIGTVGGGLNRLDMKTKKFKRIGIQDGLCDNTIYTIEEDEEGILWMGTNKGLCSYNPFTKESHVYTPEDGIQDYEFNRNAVLKTKDNHLLFGGINGFNMFNPSDLTPNNSSTNLVLSSFKVNDSERFIGTKEIELSHNENFLKFQFNLLDYYKTDKIQYAYMMEGLEDKWNYSGNSNMASYPALNTGTYTFKVKAANSDGHWSNKTIAQSITISPVWWKTWWFSLFSLGAIATLFYTFYRSRQNQKEKIIELRNRISRDLHDEIGSTLSSISLFGTVAKKMVESGKDGSQVMLNRINDSTTQVMESMNDIVWAINSDNDKIDNLLKRMRAFASELSDASDIKVTFDIDEKIKNATINMVQRRNVYLIYKESINNAFKYSKAMKIEVRLSPVHKSIQLTIMDDGVGFDLNEVSSQSTLGGNGLKNIESRAAELEGKLQINSTSGKGTEIQFSWNPNFEPKL